MSQGLREEPQCPVELRGAGITHIKGAELMETPQAREWCPRTPQNTQMGGESSHFSPLFFPSLHGGTPSWTLSRRQLARSTPSWARRVGVNHKFEDFYYNRQGILITDRTTFGYLEMAREVMGLTLNFIYVGGGEKQTHRIKLKRRGRQK